MRGNDAIGVIDPNDVNHVLEKEKIRVTSIKRKTDEITYTWKDAVEEELLLQ